MAKDDTDAVYGEKMIEVKIRFWTNKFASEPGKIIPTHAWTQGVVRMESNPSHGIMPQRPKSLTRGAVRERLLFRRLARASVTLPSWGAQLEAAEQMRQIRPIRRKLEQELDAISKLPAALLRRAFAGDL